MKKTRRNHSAAFKAKVALAAIAGGKTVKMMEHIARFTLMSRRYGWSGSRKMFEPLSMVTIGIVIEITVVLTYLSIFELAGSIQ